jgi:rhamnogalacturonyl hydrolase YesR
MEVILYALTFVAGLGIGVALGTYRGIRIGYEFATPRQTLEEALDGLIGQMEEKEDGDDTVNVNATNTNGIWYFHDEYDNFILQNNDYKTGIKQLREKYTNRNIAVYVVTDVEA